VGAVDGADPLPEDALPVPAERRLRHLQGWLEGEGTYGFRFELQKLCDKKN
jgi:hypothetical protein